ncbi:MAG: ABC-2 family transporter protein [Litorilinea sp.]
MFATLAFHWQIYRRLIGAQLRAQMQYRVSMLFEIAATALIMSLFFVSLALVMQRLENIGGWNLAQIAFLWGMVETGFGLMDMFFSGFDPAFFGRRVRQGTFDELLLRPVSVTVQVFGDQFVIRRLGRIIQGLAILTFAFSTGDIAWTAAKIAYLPLVLAGLVLYFGGLFIVGATITFWTVESIEAINVFTYGGSEMLAYPMHIYPDILRRTFTYILPAALLNYYPALYILDLPDPMSLPGWLRFVAPLAGGLLFAGALAFWRFGVRHYHSTGS